MSFVSYLNEGIVQHYSNVFLCFEYLLLKINIFKNPHSGVTCMYGVHQISTQYTLCEQCNLL